MLAQKVRNSKYKNKSAGFNMTPMIDVVFLLIVFFMLICQFITQDNERLTVPDNCETAEQVQQKLENEIIVQVWYDSNSSSIIYSVAGHDIPCSIHDVGGDTGGLTVEIANSLKKESEGIKDPIVRLRGDNMLSCEQIRPAIKAAAAAGLASIRFSAFKEDEPDN